MHANPLSELALLYDQTLVTSHIRHAACVLGSIQCITVSTTLAPFVTDDLLAVAVVAGEIETWRIGGGGGRATRSDMSTALMSGRMTMQAVRPRLPVRLKAGSIRNISTIYGPMFVRYTPLSSTFMPFHKCTLIA